MYKVKVEVYDGSLEFTVAFKTWELAMASYNTARQILTGKWTRHSAIPGEISHMEVRSDIYNEGSIMIMK